MLRYLSIQSSWKERAWSEKTTSHWKLSWTHTSNVKISLFDLWSFFFSSRRLTACLFCCFLRNICSTLWVSASMKIPTTVYPLCRLAVNKPRVRGRVSASSLSLIWMGFECKVQTRSATILEIKTYKKHEGTLHWAQRLRRCSERNNWVVIVQSTCISFVKTYSINKLCCN